MTPVKLNVATLVAAGAILVPPGVAVAQVQRYDYRLLESPRQFSDIFPQGINNHGEVAGDAFPRDPYTGRRQAAWWDKAGRINILPMADTDLDAYARDIADDGTVVGQTVRRASYYGRPTVWRNGQQQFLPESPGEGGIGVVSAGGAAFGGALRRSRDEEFVAAYWSGGKVYRLDGLPGFASRVWSVNEAGQYVGLANLPQSAHPVCFVGSGGDYALFEPPGLNVIRLFDINDHGVMGGAVLVNGRSRGLVTDGQRHRTLAPLGGDDDAWVKEVNNDGVAVGESWGDDISNWYKVVVYQPGESEPKLLASLVNAGSASFSHAIDMNEAGQILAGGAVDGVPGHYVLTPVPAARSVPEPAGAVVAVVPLWLGTRSQRRRRDVRGDEVARATSP